MRYILEGKFCGLCHLKVAFPLDDCRRCHPQMKMSPIMPARREASPSKPRTTQPGSSATAEPWREVFARICRHTEDAAWLPPEEIAKLIRESDALLATLGELQIPQAKVYRVRLEKCRAFFEYALELQESPGTREVESDG